MINIDLLSKILNSKKENNIKILEIEKFIDIDIFNTFSKLNFINFDKSDLSKLENIKKDIKKSNIFVEELDNKKVWIKNKDNQYLRDGVVQFKTLEVLYKYSTDIFVVEKNDNYIKITEEELNDLFLLENEYGDILEGIIKYIIYPHSNVKYTNVDFITSIFVPKNLIVDEIIESEEFIENVRVNRKNKFCDEFDMIIEKYKNNIAKEIIEYKNTGILGKNFSIALIRESIEDEFDEIEKKLQGLKHVYNTKILEEYIKEIEELKEKFRKLL